MACGHYYHTMVRYVPVSVTKQYPYSAFTLAAGHGTVQYGTAWYAYFFKCKQVS